MTDEQKPDMFSQDPTEAPKRWRVPAFLRKPWVIVAIALGITGLVVAFSINQIMLALLHSRPEVVVPKLEGKSLMEAVNIVSKVDLSIQQEGTDFDDSLPAGTIVRQVPPSGMQVRAGRAIRVVISKGGQVVFIPDIVGKPLAEAQSVLATDGLQMGAVSELYSSEAARNVVITQSPSSGTVATKGVLVDVEVSKGLPPSGLPLIPDFTGKTIDNAREWASGVNTTVKVKEDPKAVGPAGTIFKQDPLPGQPLLEGQDILVTAVAASAGNGKHVSYQVPLDAGDVTIRIMRRDDKGESWIYEGKHKGGAQLEIPVTVTATSRFRVYMDDVLKDEKVVEP